MGKVASSSIYHALKKRSDYYAFHTHDLHPKNIQLKLKECEDSFWNPDRRLRANLLLYNSHILPKRSLKIITLVRNPFERNISDYFENSSSVKEKYSNQSTFVQSLIKHFIESQNHQITTEWYLKEFNEVMDLNIFDYEFDHEQRWSVIKNQHYHILTLRTDLSDDCKAKVIEDFLGIDELFLKRSNQTGAKSINSIYKEFKEKIRFPSHLGEEILNSKFTQHFFSKKEIGDMRVRWLAK